MLYDIHLKKYDLNLDENGWVRVEELLCPLKKENSG